MIALRQEARIIGGPIRLAKHSDIASLAGMERACFRTDRIDEPEFRALLSDTDVRIFVCAEAKALYGLLVFVVRRAERHGYIYSLAVAERRRGEGLARRLVEAACRAARDLGLAEMILEVRPDNGPALVTYQTLGFVTSGRVENWYQDGSAAIIMSHRL